MCLIHTNIISWLTIAFMLTMIKTFQQKGIEIWARPILPVYKGKYSYGIVFLNRRTDGTPSEVNISQ